MQTHTHIPLKNYTADLDQSEATYVTVSVRATSITCTHPLPLPVEFSSEWNEVVPVEVCATEIQAKRRTKHYNYFDNANVEDELEELR